MNARRILAGLGRSWDKALIAGATLGTLLPTSPPFLPIPGRDSGVFLYIGWRILNGEIPYRDVWDHKPPFVYYIDAVGLLLTSHSLWGVWFLEWLSILVAAYIGFRLIRSVLGTYPALLGSLLWLLTLISILTGGNLTEEYALPLQFACLWLIHNHESRKFPGRRLLLIGVLCGIAFFIKQTTIGIGAAIVLYLIVSRLMARRGRTLLGELAALAGGALAVCGFVTIYFAANQALSQFWSAAFLYNFAYVSGGGNMASRLGTLLQIGESLTWSWILQIALLGWIAALWIVFRRKDLYTAWSPLLAIALLDLPIEVLLIVASGRPYVHYLISLLPVLAILAAVAFRVTFATLPTWARSNAAKAVFAAALVAALMGRSTAIIRSLIRYHKEQAPVARVLTYIRTSTSTDDTVLFWGAEASLNFMARRRSPSQFVYLYPLYEPGYADEKMIEGFLGHVVRNHPRLIIQPESPLTPIYDFPVRSALIESANQYLKSHYVFRQSFGDWAISEYVDNGGQP